MEMKKIRLLFALGLLVLLAVWIKWSNLQTSFLSTASGKDVVATQSPVEVEYKLKPTGSVTFTRDIAPIVFSNCATCHRPGEAAPFSLLSYQETKKRAKQIAHVTGTRFMPPWKVEKSDYTLKYERRLTNEQIGLIKQWAEEGAPEGDPADLPARPKFTEGWQLGAPDLTVKMGQAFSVPADGPDIYRSFAIPLNLSEDKWVRAIEFRPRARSVVHHSLFFFDATGAARKRDEEDPLPGYNGGMGGLNRGAGGGRLMEGTATATRSPIGTLGGWAVGGQARALPDGLAWYLPKGADLILSTHFHPSGKAEKEISTIGIYFSDKPPAKTFAGVQLPPLFGVFEGIDIRPGDKDYKIEDSFVLPIDVNAFGVGAHAHYLGRQMLLTATLPNGETKTLLWIKDWDFSWQDQYQFQSPVSLPKGTRLTVKINYDNSTDNPRNPSSPPKQVRWGEGSTDEMGSMSLMVVAANEADLPQLQQAFTQHIRRAFIRNPPFRLLLQRGNRK